MIRNITRGDIPDCVRLIRESFLTVAEQYNITKDNAPGFTAFAIDENRMITQMEQGREQVGYFRDGKIIGHYSLEDTGL